MKNIITASIVSILIVMPTLASIPDNTCIVPRDCNIVSSEFSSGGGKSPSYLMEIDCDAGDGLITKYVDHELSIGGMLGLGRWSSPSKINFIRRNDDEDKFECNY